MIVMQAPHNPTNPVPPEIRFDATAATSGDPANYGHLTIKADCNLEIERITCSLSGGHIVISFSAT